MIKAFTLICRRPDLTHAAFAAYWRDIHAGVVMGVEALRPLRYVQNHLEDAAAITPGRTAVDGIAESWRASVADLPQALHENPLWLATVRPDEERFVAVGETANIVAEEFVPVDGAESSWKLIAFRRQASAGIAATRHVVNRPLPGRQRLLSGGEAPVIWALVEEFWFADEAALIAAHRQLNAGSDVAVIARQHVVHDGRPERG